MLRSLSVLVVIAVLAFTAAVPVFAQQKPASPPAVDQEAFERAETKLLRAQIDRLNAQIEELRAQLRTSQDLLDRYRATFGELDQPADQPVEDFTAPADSGGQEAPDVPAKPRRVFYIVDNSGSMIGKDRKVLAEITKAINNLESNQYFGITLMSGGSAFPPKNLTAATDASKRKASEFMATFQVVNESNPIPGFKLAFAARPEVIWFISDGDFNYALNANEKVLAEVKRIAGRTRINTVFVRSESGEMNLQERSAVRPLVLLAQQHGGKCLDMEGNEIELPPDPKAEQRNAPTPVPAPSGPSIFD